MADHLFLEAEQPPLAPVIADIRAEGTTTLRGIAAALSDRGMRTRRGGRWQVSNVKGLLGRLGA